LEKLGWNMEKSLNGGWEYSPPAKEEEDTQKILGRYIHILAKKI